MVVVIEQKANSSYIDYRKYTIVNMKINPRQGGPLNTQDRIEQECMVAINEPKEAGLHICPQAGRPHARPKNFAWPKLKRMNK